MPEMLCVKRNGVSYCWNFEAKRVEVFTKEVVEVKDCPADVMYDLLVLVSEKLSAKDREGLKCPNV